MRKHEAEMYLRSTKAMFWNRLKVVEGILLTRTQDFETLWNRVQGSGCRELLEGIEAPPGAFPIVKEADE